MKKSMYLLGIALVLFSCNSGNKETSDSVSDDATGTVNKSAEGNSYDCLKQFQEDYSKLLTKEEMASVYPFKFDEAKVDLSPGNYGSHIYSWPSDRPDVEQEISGMKIKGPDYNTMGVTMLSFYSNDKDMQSTRDYFDMGYKQLSEKELKQIDENLEKQDEEIKNTGKDMMKIRANRSWEFVDGTGNSAWYKWNERWGGELAVLAGKATFNIKVKVSEDPDENRGIAEKLAEMILEKCN